MSTTKRMTITEALVELKNYDNRIRKAINTAMFIGAKKKKDKKVGNLSVEKFEANAKASYDSIMAMMENRSAIKRAVVLSNAITKVTVDGKEMTVAEAIEKRNLNDTVSFLLGTMEQQISSCENMIFTKNADVDVAAEKLLVSYYGKDAAKKVSSEDYHTIVDPYKEANEWELVDPLGLRDVHDKIDNENDNFLANVDSVLSISNATTFIEVEMQ